VRTLTPTESQSQIAVMDHCRWRATQDARYANVVKVPNEGKRSASYGVRMKREGLAKGFPDLMVLYPMGGFHGMFIEMKREGEKVRPEQREWISKLRRAGYLAGECYSADEAIRRIDSYLGMRG
jgi:hypothetical protein